MLVRGVRGHGGYDRTVSRSGKLAAEYRNEAVEPKLAKDDNPARAIWIFRIFHFFCVRQNAQDFVPG